MVIRDVFDHITIVVKGTGPVSWRDLVFKGSPGSLYRIVMDSSFRIFESVAAINGEAFVKFVMVVNVSIYSTRDFYLEQSTFLSSLHTAKNPCTLHRMSLLCLFLPILVLSISTTKLYPLFDSEDK
ncbi:hypothetical protein RF11_05186 [Thelohanellus kitauei]|uniref:Uncharacterized protein n=1 Tax=Thelohanellus kitauei TaxID=669202 RepID=A0A0C2N1C4_THEKT|nr:hypothetical protein RF11_05186 [Thelohanellus kitauei]